MKSTSNSRLLDCLEALRGLEGVSEAIPVGKATAFQQHLAVLEAFLGHLNDQAGQGDPASAGSETGSFTLVAVAALEGLRQDAQKRGIRLDYEFSPSLRRVDFAPGGSILVGLVEQALAIQPGLNDGRRLVVTAGVDKRNRILIGIQDSITPDRDAYSIRELGQWRRRLTSLGGELRLRNVPFGHGMTIEAHVPGNRRAA